MGGRAPWVRGMDPFGHLSNRQGRRQTQRQSGCAVRAAEFEHDAVAALGAGRITDHDGNEGGAVLLLLRVLCPDHPPPRVEGRVIV